MGGGAFGRNAKYKVVTKTLFPKQQSDGIVRHNVSAFVQFASINTNRLVKIGKYLEKRAKREIANKGWGYLEVVTEAFNSLITACQAHIGFFASNVLAVLKLLMAEQRIELKLLCAETFIKFTSALAGDITYQHDMEYLVPYFVAMCGSNHKDANMLRRLRIAGFRGLRTYTTETNDLDSFVSNYIEDASQQKAEHTPGMQSIIGKGEETLPPIIPTIVENMRYEGKGGERKSKSKSDKRKASVAEGDEIDDSDEEVANQAEQLLQDIGANVNIVTSRSLFTALLEYFDQENLWTPPDFPIVVLRALGEVMQVQHDHTLTTCMLQHLDTLGDTSSFATPREKASAATSSNDELQVKTSVLKVLVSCMRRSTGPIVEVLNSLLHHLIMSLPPASSASESDKVAKSFQQETLHCLAFISEKTRDANQKLEAMDFILDRMSKHRGKDQQAARSLLSKSLVTVADSLTGRNVVLKQYQSLLLGKLIKAMKDENKAIRVNTLLSTERVYRACFSGHSFTLAASILSTANDGFTKDVSDLRIELYRQLLRPDNTPEHFEHIAATLSLMAEDDARSEIVVSLPLLFGFQSLLFEKKHGKHDQQQIECSLFFVGAHLLQFADLLGCSALQTYVKEVIHRQNDAGQGNASALKYEEKAKRIVARTSKRKHHSSKSKEEGDKILLEQKSVVEALRTLSVFEDENDALSKCETVAFEVKAKGRRSKHRKRKHRRKKEDVTSTAGTDKESTAASASPAVVIEVGQDRDLYSFDPANRAGVVVSVGALKQALDKNHTSLSGGGASTLFDTKLPYQQVVGKCQETAAKRHAGMAKLSHLLSEDDVDAGDLDSFSSLTSTLSPVCLLEIQWPSFVRVPN
eukprot:TRINITY_DN2901_c0_g1_i1.p1 TRINITY_DN2901_c0_g1~~TRINITY_DN2901_c0_g1_i1.p1  ORF type:complete len:878 (+),score=237.75 TRINITY_DN2901_c0_g1_i1:45-2636(+)